MARVAAAAVSLLAAALPAPLAGHPVLPSDDLAGHPRRLASASDPCAASPPPNFSSYHIHLLFWPDLEPGYNEVANSRSGQGAFEIQLQFVERFGVDLGRNCTDCHLFGNCTGALKETFCMFTYNPRPGFGINTPFLVPNWAAYVPLARFAEAVPWIMQNRGAYDVFVHPNSGCFIQDTLDWSVWGGHKWEVALPSDRGPLGGDRRNLRGPPSA